MYIHNIHTAAEITRHVLQYVYSGAIVFDSSDVITLHAG